MRRPWKRKEAYIYSAEATTEAHNELNSDNMSSITTNTIDNKFGRKDVKLASTYGKSSAGVSFKSGYGGAADGEDITGYS